MFSIKTTALAAMLGLPMAIAMADPSSSTTQTAQGSVHACPAGKYDANYPGAPKQCVECAAPGCPSCHNERTKTTVADTAAAERNCPPAVKPH